MKYCCLLSVLLCLLLLGCSSNRTPASALINQEASLTGDLPANPLAWKVITSAINEQDSTMSTLYGNDAAVQYARTAAGNDYPAGAELALVTWFQRDDDHWFGARIPAKVKSVEFVTVGATPDQSHSYSYQSYEGTPLKETTATVSPIAAGRAGYLLSQRAAVMP